MRSFFRSESGAVAVYIALISPILIGFAGLGSEVGMWMMTQRKIQHIADVAAYTAATRALSTTNSTTISTAVRDRATGAGMLSTDTLNLSLPPATGPNAGSKSHAEVVVTRVLPRYLTALFSGTDDTVTITARAVAGVEPGSGELACIVALAQTGVSLSIGGSGDLTMVTCAAGSNSVAANSINRIGSNAGLTTTCIYTVGGTTLVEDNVDIIFTDPNCGTPRIRQRPTADPFADLPMLATSDVGWINSVTPTVDPLNRKKVTYAPRQTISSFGGLPVARFSSLSLRDEVVFDPGLYIIDGGNFTINAGAVVTGTNVSFYLMNGATLSVSGTASLDLQAYVKATNTRTDPYSGILFFGDRLGPSVSHSFTGNSSSTLTGLFYFPVDTVNFSGAGGLMSPCIRILSSRIAVSGNSTISLDCNFGTAMPDYAPKIEAQQRITLKE